MKIFVELQSEIFLADLDKGKWQKLPIEHLKWHLKRSNWKNSDAISGEKYMKMCIRKILNAKARRTMRSDTFIVTFKRVFTASRYLYLKKKLNMHWI